MTVHDLEAHRRARSGRRRSAWGIAGLAIGVLVVLAIGLVIAALFAIRHTPSRGEHSDLVATQPHGACLPLVAHVGPAECPFAAIDAAEGAIDWAAPFERGRSCVRAGGLVLPTGQVVAADPLVNADRPPLLAMFPAGTHGQVWLAISEDEMSEGSNAFAMLLVGDARPVRFEEARDTRGGNAYGVDSGTGSFLDAQGARWIEAHLLSEPRLFDVMQAGGYFTARSVNLCLDEARGENMVAFQSGVGDGAYVTYAGYDAAGTLVALVTDFGVVEMGAGLHPWLADDPGE